MKTTLTTLAAACTLCAGSVRGTDWTYIPATGDGTISNGVWELYVHVNDDDARTLTLGRSGSPYAAHKSGSAAELDLEHAVIRDAADDIWTITRIGGGAFEQNVPGLVSFLAPTTTRHILGWAFASATALTNVVIHAPGLLTVESYAFYGNDQSFCNATNDAADFVPRGVRVIGDRAFSCVPFTGDLVLTNLMSAGHHAFAGCVNIDALHLEGSELVSIPNEFFTWAYPLRIFVDAPALKHIGRYAFSAHPSLAIPRLESIVIHAPELESIGDGAFDGEAGNWQNGYHFAVTNSWADFIPPSVKSIGSRGIYVVFAHGVLDLPNLVTLGESALVALNQTSELRLESPDLSVIPSTAFGWNESIRSLIIGSTNLVSVSGDCFRSSVTLTNLTFYGPAPSTDALDSLMSCVAPEVDGICACVLGVSRRQAGWLELASGLTEAEAAHAPERCFGVYREGLRKAWMVAIRSPYDTVGATALIVR